MISRIALLLGALCLSSGLSANDFPTQARVEYVLACMERHGGQTYENMYACVCAIDQLASTLPYDDYVQVEMLSFLRGTPGERGGIFRDAAPDSRERVNALEQAREEAEGACFPKRAPE